MRLLPHTLVVVSYLLAPLVTDAAVNPASIVSPRPAGWVIDQAQLLSPDDITALNALGDHVHARDGAEITIVTLRTTAGGDARRFATELFNHWGIGSQARHNGLLLFVAIDDRAAEIILGDGIDSDAEVAASERIMQDVIVPRFRARQPAEAIMTGARACAERFFGVQTPTAESTPVEGLRPAQPVQERLRTTVHVGSSKGGWLAGGVGTGVFGIVAWLVGRAYARRRPRRCRNCSMTMVKLDEAADDAHLAEAERAEERVGSVDYDIWQCPGCSTVEKLRYGRWFTRYSRCPGCGAATKSKTSRTLRAATTMSTGLVEVHERCAHCTYQNTYLRTTPRVSKSSSSGRRSSSGFGGGRSSGRGASGRW